MNNVQTQVLLAVIAGASASFLSTPSNQFQSTFNSTFLDQNEILLKPIVIPNLIDSSNTPKVNETHKTKTKNHPSELYLKKKTYPEKKEFPQESTVHQSFSEKQAKPEENSLKFSSRYSSKPDLDEEIKKDVKGTASAEESATKKSEDDVKNVTETREASSEHKTKEAASSEGKYKFSDRSDDTYLIDSYSDEDDDSHRYSDSNEPRDAEEVEELEVTSTTSDPYSEIRRPHPEEDDFENYETSSREENEDSEEEKEEVDEKRSVEDYHDSGSKNYHSVQTPLSKIQFRGPHAFKDDFDSGKTRTRLIEPIRRRPINYNWPYSKAQLKAEKETSNEIPHEDDWKVEEPRTDSKLLGLELAAEKDEAKFEETLKKPYNYIEDRNLKRQRQNGLATEEEKDHKSPFYQSLKHYKVDEEEPISQPKNQFGGRPKSKVQVWSTSLPKSNSGKVPPHKIPLKTKSYQETNIIPSKFNITKELTPNFQGRQFLGPVVFNQNHQDRRLKPTPKTNYINTQTVRNIFLKDLEEKERFDQENLTNQRIQKAIPLTGKLTTQSFDHLQESDEMYNQILANIQSVFGIRTQPLKSATNRKIIGGSIQELNLEENRSLTWSLPLVKQEKSNPGASESFPSKGRGGNVKGGSEGVTAFRKPDVLQS